MNESTKKIAKKCLKKTKVDLHTSEYQITEIIHEFYRRCVGEKTECDNCDIVKNSILLGNSSLCLARYIYEKTVKIYE